VFPRDYFPSLTTSLTPLDENAAVYAGSDGTKYLIETHLHPASIPGLQLWLRADSLTNLPDGSAVTSWNDSSGQGRNASAPTTAGAQPTYQAIARNGRPALQFNGTTQFLSGPAANWQTFFAVAFCSTSPTLHMSLWGASPSTTDMSVRRLSTGPTYCHGNGNDFAPTPSYRIDGTPTNSVPNGIWHLVSCQAASPRNFPYRVAGTGGQPARLWAGAIAEILVYDSALSLLNTQKVEQYLASKYGLPPPR
jgi:hypothetical protein